VASRGEMGSPAFCPACSTASTSTTNTTSPPKSRKLLVWAADKRVRVLNATYPYSAVGQIVGVSSSWHGYTCSGALFGPSYVLTAGAQHAALVRSRQLSLSEAVCGASCVKLPWRARFPTGCHKGCLNVGGVAMP